jgi:hypothetical protein
MFGITESLQKKWRSVVDHPDLPKITDPYRKKVVAQLLENEENALKEERTATQLLNENLTTTGAVQNWDPVLISLVRRAMPNLVAYDICGVQPMNGPTGLIFAMRAKFIESKNNVNAGDEGLYYSRDGDIAKPPTAFSGKTDANVEGVGLDTRTGEALGRGESGDEEFGTMGFTIDKVTVTAKTRALKAEYTMELAQDLKKIHGLDAEPELANILSTEILAEINREVIATINWSAKRGGTADVSGNDDGSGISTTGEFDLAVDADGRWAVEKFKSLLFQVEKEANYIAKSTRRGKGNFILCSSNVASALAAAGVLNYAPAMSTNLNVDDTGNTFAGTLMGIIKVFIDPYAATDYVTAGYRGSNTYDAGIFYAPYVPVTMVRAVDPDTFQPKIAFKTRYGMVANPFVISTSQSGADRLVGRGRNFDLEGIGAAASNIYFRKFNVFNLNVGPANLGSVGA